MNRQKEIATALPLLAHDRYRWMLLAGWFTLISTLFAFVVAAPSRPGTADGTLVLIAMAAFISYSVAMKRYWIALALFVAVAAAVVTTLS